MGTSENDYARNTCASNEQDKNNNKERTAKLYIPFGHSTERYIRPPPLTLVRDFDFIPVIII